MDQVFVETHVLPFLSQCHLDCRAPQLHLIDMFREHLFAANRVFNLTRVVDEHDFWLKHVADSLSIGILYPDLFRKRRTVADIGFGGGFPIVPLAWANPQLMVHGIERTRRKAHFVRDEAVCLGLDNITVHLCQAREAAQSETLAGKCDVVVARAVDQSGPLLKRTRTLLRPGNTSRLVLYKTPDGIQQELPVAEREAGKYGFKIEISPRIELPCGAGERQFISFFRQS